MAITRTTWISGYMIVALFSIGCAADTDPTSLAGDIACGTTTCRDGEICRVFEPHPDPTGASLQYSCFAVSGGCAVVDCQGEECPACLRSHCGYLISVMGRELFCGGF